MEQINNCDTILFHTLLFSEQLADLSPSARFNVCALDSAVVPRHTPWWVSHKCIAMLLYVVANLRTCPQSLSKWFLKISTADQDQFYAANFSRFCDELLCLRTFVMLNYMAVC